MCDLTKDFISPAFECMIPLDSGTVFPSFLVCSLQMTGVSWDWSTYNPFGGIAAIAWECIGARRAHLD